MLRRIQHLIGQLIIAGLAAALAGGCATNSLPAAPAVASSADYRYLIGPGDTVTSSCSAIPSCR